MGREDEIKLIAFKIWEEEGCVDGSDCEHWFRAEVTWEEQQKQKGVKQNTKARAAKKKSRKT